MKRTEFITAAALSSAALAVAPIPTLAKTSGVPWETLRRRLDGRLIPLQSPFRQCSRSNAACDTLFSNLKNPYFIGDDPALTQTLGWADAWTSATSRYAVAAQHAGDIAAAVNFARDYGVRLVVKGGGHSYLGTSNAADSLLIWTRHMNDIVVGEHSVKISAGAMWGQAYEVVTTQNGRYVQGGGCTTVGVAGLIQSGGFGSFSKRFGTAAASLLEAEVVTADGAIRTVNGRRDPELFWALKGGGGGSFGIVTSVTLKLHDLAEFAGGVDTQIQASSDAAYRELIERFLAFYSESLMNAHWGESVTMRPDNILSINMVSWGLSPAEIALVWRPFFDAIRSSPSKFRHLDDAPYTGGGLARHWWDHAWRLAHGSTSVKIDPRSRDTSHWWWSGDSDQVGVFLYGYESLWMPASLLEADTFASLVEACFRASRHHAFAFHFNKGLAGAPADAIAASRDTATNPNVLEAFALAICADGEQGLYPGVHGHEPDLRKARAEAHAIHDCVGELRHIAPGGGSYVSESNFFEPSFGSSYWGINYARLVKAKEAYDPDNLFMVRNGVQSRRKK